MNKLENLEDIEMQKSEAADQTEINADATSRMMLEIPEMEVTSDLDEQQEEKSSEKASRVAAAPQVEQPPSPAESVKAVTEEAEAEGEEAEAEKPADEVAETKKLSDVLFFFLAEEKREKIVKGCNTCSTFTRKVIDKFSIISIGKKSTGSMYINGKTHYASGIDFCLSIFVYAILIATFTSLCNRLGLISDNKISLIPDYESFTSMKLSSLG